MGRRGTAGAEPAPADLGASRAAGVIGTTERIATSCPQHRYKTWEVANANPAMWFALWQDVGTSLATEEDIPIALLEQAMADDRELISKGLMTQAEYDQEWYLSPDAAIRGTFYAKEMASLRDKGRITRVPYERAHLYFAVFGDEPHAPRRI